MTVHVPEVVIAANTMPSMKGENHYNAHSQPQQLAAMRSIPLVQQAAAHIGSNILHKLMKCTSDINNSDMSVTVVDYGSSQGNNSINVIKSFIAQVRESSKLGELSIVIIHEDQPGNDWNALFKTITCNMATELNTSYMSDQYIHTLASPIGFYSAVVPNSTVDFGCSFAAMHWLSHVVAPINTHFDINCVKAGVEDDTVQLWRDAAAADWLRLLTLRSKELKSNGYLLISCMSRDSAGDNGVQNLLNSMKKVLKRCVQMNIITVQQYKSINSQLYTRSQVEILHGIKQLPSLELISFQQSNVSAQYYGEYMQHQDIKKYAVDTIEYLKAWFEPILMSALIDCEPSTVKSFWREMLQDCIRYPVQYHHHYVNAYVLCRKL